MAFPNHAKDWIAKADIDYVGPFVKAWAAFNAWYRESSGETVERKMLDYVNFNQNSRLRIRMLPLLDDDEKSPESLNIKRMICDLHTVLENVQFEVTRKTGQKERISFRAVCLRPRQLDCEEVSKYGYKYRAERIQGGDIRITVTKQRPNSQVIFQHTQEKYDPPEVYAQPEFKTKLSEKQQTQLRQLYDSCNPRPMTDLIHGTGAYIDASTIKLYCSKEDLLATLVEIIYTMRNALLHGETAPDKEILACYEPAYKILMVFLSKIQ